MTLRESLEKLNSEELIERLLQQSFTDDADKVVREILVSRGIVPPSSDEHEQIPHSKTPIRLRITELIKMSIRGQASLGEAYWNLGLLLFGIAIVSMIGYSLTVQGFLGNFFAGLLIITIVLGTPFHAYCVWKCKTNTNSQLWGQIAGFYAFLQLFVFCGLLPIGLIASYFQ